MLWPRTEPGSTADLPAVPGPRGVGQEGARGAETPQSQAATKGSLVGLCCSPSGTPTSLVFLPEALTARQPDPSSRTPRSLPSSLVPAPPNLEWGRSPQSRFLLPSSVQPQPKGPGRPDLIPELIPWACPALRAAPNTFMVKQSQAGELPRCCFSREGRGYLCRPSAHAGI